MLNSKMTASPSQNSEKLAFSEENISRKNDDNTINGNNGETTKQR
jgi:hypothetical protein